MTGRRTFTGAVITALMGILFVPVPGESGAHHDWIVQTLQAAKAKGSPVFIVQHIPLQMKRDEF